MSTSIKISGVGKALSFLKKKGRRTEAGAKEGLRKAGLFVRGEVSTSIARGTNAAIAFKTGQLSRSIDFVSDKDDAVIFTNIKHGKFVEFGTTRMAPRQHFRNTLFKNKSKITNIIQKEIKNI